MELFLSGRFSGNREPSGQQAPRDSYGQQYPYGTGHRILGTKMIMAVHFPMERAVLAKWSRISAFSPSGWPPQEPKQKMSVGVKVFIVILAVLAVSFIGGFAGFGIYVVVQQQDGTHHLNQAIITVLLNLPMILLLWMRTQLQTFLIKRDPDFQGITLSSADSETLTPEQVYMKSIGIHGQRFGDFYRQYNRKWILLSVREAEGHCNFQWYISLQMHM